MRKLSVLLFLCLSIKSFSQNTSFQDKYQLRVLKSETPIKIDGEPDEPIWQKAIGIGDFWEKFPDDKSKAQLKTFAKAAFDDKFLYFVVTCFDSTNRFVAPSLKRDGFIRTADGISVILDPVNKKSNGFSFSVTPYNVQTEYLFAAGTDGSGVSAAWDNKWISAVKRHADRYVIEIAIPFKTLRFDANNKVWGVNFIRSDQKNNKFYAWTNIPVQFPGFDLGYVGTMTFEEDLPKAKGNVSLIPYITGSAASDVENNSLTKAKFNAGFDAKVSLSPSMNLDLTVNPDFSQVDVDVQVTNLTRFNIQFPEKRTFFLENDDIFSGYGPPPYRPFFSRRIGLDANGNSIPILFGGRISGNLTKKLRIGVMNMQTGRKGDFASQNYSAASFNQRIFARSSIKGYFLNREGSLTDVEQKANPLGKFGRNAGMELNLTDKTGVWQLWGGHHISFKPMITSKNNFSEIGVGYYGRKLNSFVDIDRIGENYYADMGFINRIETFSTKGSTYDSGDITYRNGFVQMFNQNDYFLYPKNKKVIRHTFGLENYAVWFLDGKLSDRFHRLRYFMMMKNTSMWAFRFDIQQDNLKYYFPLPSEKPLTPGTYSYNSGNIQYTSDSRKNLFFDASLRIGQFYNGTIEQYRASLTVRKQPYWNVAMNLEYNNLKFPSEFGNTKLWLISPKVEINFSNSLFWTTFFQYNTQRNNFNINSRVQWRYKPMSDLFVVYTDNYFADNLNNRNRALVFKLNYWLTL